VLPQELAFPLVPRARLAGIPFGSLASTRRGVGSDFAGMRSYRPGDELRLIDWKATARLSALGDLDDFLVREHYADEAPCVVVVADRRPAMGIYQPPSPWLDKGAAMGMATAGVVASAARARASIGYVDHRDGREPFWIEPSSSARFWAHESAVFARDGYFAPDDAVTVALGHLARYRTAVPAGTFVFVCSDFLNPPPTEEWLRALAHGWDVVPVVIQDPLWEQSFPVLPASVVLRLADPGGSIVAPVRVTRLDAARRRRANELRRAALLDDLRSLRLEPVLVDGAEPDQVRQAFLRWAEERLAQRGHA
jgi:uncharacterized protein (DUF58 family)